LKKDKIKGSEGKISEFAERKGRSKEGNQEANFE